MTVDELIKELEQYNPEAKVLIEEFDCEHGTPFIHPVGKIKLPDDSPIDNKKVLVILLK